MPEFNNAKVRILEDQMYADLESVPGLECGTPESRRWLARYAVALGLDLAAFLRLLMALGVQRLGLMGDDELDAIAAVTGKGVYRVRGNDQPEW